MMIPIHLRNTPPPLVTMNHTSILSFFASYIKPIRYLELGVYDGSNFIEISKYCKTSYAVDVVECQFELQDNMVYHKTTTDDFFKILPSPSKLQFDMIFIDANHSHSQSLKDFNNAEKYLIDDGFIFLHDTYPYNNSMFIPEFCDDAYKTALYIKQNLIDNFEIVTLPFNPGLTIVKKINRNKQLLYQT